jgi:hypothetical protein
MPKAGSYSHPRGHGQIILLSMKDGLFRIFAFLTFLSKSSAWLMMQEQCRYRHEPLQSARCSSLCLVFLLAFYLPPPLPAAHSHAIPDLKPRRRHSQYRPLHPTLSDGQTHRSVSVNIVRHFQVLRANFSSVFNFICLGRSLET